jgi:hypothetical protein
VSRLGDAIGRRPREIDDVEPPADDVGAGSAPDGFERLFVYGLLLVGTIGVCYYVYRFGRNVPFWDDWELVPGLVGAERADLAWLWRQHNEHRYPVTGLVILAVWRFFGDLRFVMLATNLVLSALALLFVRAARAVRGRTSYTDAFFPLVFLSWGHYENMIFTAQMFFVVPVALASAVMAVAARDRWRGHAWQIVGVVACLVLLPLHGAMGIVLVLPAALWSAVAGAERWRSRDATGRRDARLLVGGAAAACLLVGLYFVGFHSTSYHPPSPSLVASGRVMLEVLSIAVGGAGQTVWPLSGVGVAVLLVTSVALALATAFVRPEVRLRALGVGLGAASFGALAAAIGHGRAGLADAAGFSDRYAVFTTPILCGAYLAFALFAHADLARFVRVALFAVACALLLPNYREGKAYGFDRAARADIVVNDAKRGIPPEIIAARAVDKVYPDRAILAARLELLRAARASAFRDVEPQVAQCNSREAVALEVLGTHDLEWSGAAGRADGPDPYVVFVLPSPRYVCAVEVTFSLEKGTTAPATLQAFWMNSAANDFTGSERNETLSVTSGPETQTVAFPVYDTVDRFRLDPDTAPATFTVSEVVLYEP